MPSDGIFITLVQARPSSKDSGTSEFLFQKGIVRIEADSVAQKRMKQKKAEH